MPSETEWPVTKSSEAEVSRVALKGFFHISNVWGLTENETKCLLGDPSPALYQEWRAGKGPTVSLETLKRISYVFGIYKNLRILFQNESRESAWLRKPNRAFEGESALGRMSQDLASVRHYLDSFVDYPAPFSTTD